MSYLSLSSDLSEQTDLIREKLIQRKALKTDFIRGGEGARRADRLRYMEGEGWGEQKIKKSR